MRKYLIGSMLLLLAMALVACGDKEESESTDETGNPMGEPVDISDEEKVDADEVVAIVNGTEIIGSIYNTIYANLKLQSTQMSDEFDKEEVKEATLESLIDQELVRQEAESEGIEVSEEELDEEISMIKEQNEEGYKTLLEQFQMTENDFKEQLRIDLIRFEYADKKLDVAISDDDVKKKYDELKEEVEEEEELPEFDEVKDQIKQSMEQEELTLALDEKVEMLKEKAKIERKI